jgi:hypothetical protein
MEISRYFNITNLKKARGYYQKRSSKLTTFFDNFLNPAKDLLVPEKKIFNEFSI